MESELIGLSRNVDHIRQVVDRQVHLARSERTLWEPVSFQNVMEQVLAIYRPTLDRRGYEIVERYDKELEEPCDRHQVLQILVNLVSNATHAMEAVPDKPHRLTMQVSAATDRPGLIRFEVIDTGMGIASEHLHPALYCQIRWAWHWPLQRDACCQESRGGHFRLTVMDQDEGHLHIGSAD